MRGKHQLLAYLAIISFPLLTQHSFAEETETQNPPIDGKALFESVCAHCHNISYDDSAIGAPGLKGVLERHDTAWLNLWIKSPEAFAKTNETAKDLISSNKFGLAMPTLPTVQDDAKRAAIIDYLKTLK